MASMAHLLLIALCIGAVQAVRGDREDYRRSSGNSKDFIFNTRRNTRQVVSPFDAFFQSMARAMPMPMQFPGPMMTGALYPGAYDYAGYDGYGRRGRYGGPFQYLPNEFGSRMDPGPGVAVSASGFGGGAPVAAYGWSGPQGSGGSIYGSGPGQGYVTYRDAAGRVRSHAYNSAPKAAVNPTAKHNETSP